MPALWGESYEEVPVTPSTKVFAFRRWHGTSHVVGLLNLSSSPQEAALSLPLERMHLDTSRTYVLTDLLSGEVFDVTVASLGSLKVSMSPVTTRVFVLDTTAVVTRVPMAERGAGVPCVRLLQNYPNPFNGTTTIEFELRDRVWVDLQVYNVLGSRVMTLIQGECLPGRHWVPFDGERLPSGTYLCRLKAGGTESVRKIILLR